MQNPSDPSKLHSETPYLAEYDNWLSVKEIKAIFDEMPMVKYTRGKVKTRDGHHVTDYRNAFNHIVTADDRLCLTSLLGRVASWAGVKESFLEPTVLIRYPESGYFRPHHDFNIQSENGVTTHRVATAMLYLNDDFEGGSTTFGMLGAKVVPAAGKMIFFRYGYDDTTLNEQLRHSGDIVLKGTKHVICFFIRDGEFTPTQRANMSY